MNLSIRADHGREVVLAVVLDVEQVQVGLRTFASARVGIEPFARREAAAILVQ